MTENIPPPRWRPPHNRSDKPALGLIASDASQPLMEQFLVRYEDTLRNYFVIATWGTYVRSILEKRAAKPLLRQDPLASYEAAKNSKQIIPWRPRFPWLSTGYVPRPGKWGGIVEMAEHLEKSAGTDSIHVLIFFASPGDVEESYPEDRALFRSALRNEVIYLTTVQSAALWAARESEYAADRPPAPSPHDEVLALIAHNEKKIDLCRWVVEHRDRLREFQSIITTGTTGSLVKRFLRAAGVPEQKINLILQRESGPQGGDIEIAGEVMRGECQNIVFFVDPMTSHPHEGDIPALLRICSMPQVDVNIRLNEASATSWISSLQP
jgi:methylglyoxal synthase